MNQSKAIAFALCTSLTFGFSSFAADEPAKKPSAEEKKTNPEETEKSPEFFKEDLKNFNDWDFSNEELKAVKKTYCLCAQKAANLPETTKTICKNQDPKPDTKVTSKSKVVVESQPYLDVEVKSEPLNKAPGQIQHMYFSNKNPRTEILSKIKFVTDSKGNLFYLHHKNKMTERERRAGPTIMSWIIPKEINPSDYTLTSCMIIAEIPPPPSKIKKEGTPKKAKPAKPKASKPKTPTKTPNATP